MCFFVKRKKETESGRRKKRALAVAASILVCVFSLTGCGAFDFLGTESRADVEEDAGEITEKETEQEVETASSKEVTPEVSEADSQEYLQVEENQVEEKESNVSKSDLEQKRVEIGLSEAGITGLQETQAGNYYFGLLSGPEKRLYVEIYRILEIQEEEILLSTTDISVLSRVYQAVINDHPELFYLTGYTYTRFVRQDEIQYITFSGRYLYDTEEVARRQAEIDAVVGEKAGRLLGSDDYETVKAVYEDLILSTDYSLDSPDNQNICSVFLDKKSVCNGYAKAAQYLLNYFGIPCIIVNGSALGNAHAWNIVEIGGAYYHMDVTWGDPSYYSQDEVEKSGAPDIDYSYLCVTTAEISKNHSIDTMFACPECTAMYDNYFVREGLYLYGYDEGLMQGIFGAAKDRNENVVCIKASDRQVYQELYDNLIGQQKIFDYFGTYQSSGEYKIAYSGNEDLCTISFWE